ncbi:hypothetical protein AMC82_PD00960 (plasmid) [Rhizobium phaseoli]|nr:hypothetical protein AMC84_PD00964 [Rhizobium phaseoli]ANL76359.1 hypothetical protein AMC83_PE00951 [Rhizobium phaseoli]ANL82714.1 hypothetical protein AMC82_PD00960 [Rhizobium phaseoli]PDS69849.1 hypothetical protein CO651_21780 [Rhizobium phaseoli]
MRENKKKGCQNKDCLYHCRKRDGLFGPPPFFRNDYYAAASQTCLRIRAASAALSYGGPQWWATISGMSWMDLSLLRLVAMLFTFWAKKIA